MKLRIRGNSIRLRLLRGEVERLSGGESVSEAIRFGLTEKETLIYTLASSADAKQIAARFAEGEIVITLPAAAALNWARSDEVGLGAEQKLDGGENLKILVEKDFVCVERPRDADNLDAYPHPTANC